MEWLALATALWALYLLRRRTGTSGELRTLIAKQADELDSLRRQLRAQPTVAANVAVAVAVAAAENVAPRTPVTPPPVTAPPPPIEAPIEREQPATATPTSTATQKPPPAPKPKIDWESWLGVRGAALAGGIVFALAGILFFKYSIEHGLISPTLRVIIGVATGLGFIVASETILRRRYESTANSVAGAGVVILYAAFWAARALYDLIGIELAFALMILVTASACLMAVRHGSLVIAILGMCGGFATPLLLSTGADRPIALFGYVLLLDTALLFVAQKRRWPILAALSLALTILYQAMWIFARMGPDRLAIGIGILVLFALLYAVFGRMQGTDKDASPRMQKLTRLTNSSAVLAPFAFVFYFGGSSALSPHFYPLAGMMAVLLAGACYVGPKQDAHFVPLGAASASVAVSALWLMNHTMTTALAWEYAGMSVLLALGPHVFVERARDAHGVKSPSTPALTTGFGLLLFTAIAQVEAHDAAIWPWLACVIALTALLVRQGGFKGRAIVQVFAAALSAIAIASIFSEHANDAHAPPWQLAFAIEVLALIALSVTGVLRRDVNARRFADFAVVAAAVVFTASAMGRHALAAEPWIYFVFTFAIVTLGAFSAARAPSGGGLFALVITLGLTHAAWISAHDGAVQTVTAVAYIGLLAPVVLLTFWPVIMHRAFSSERFAWYAGALIGPLQFIALRRAHAVLFDDVAIGLLPIGLGALALGALAGSARTLTGDARKRALVWYAAVALSFLSVAIPLQLDKQWITIGWAIEGFALVLLWQRLDHPGLKHFALTLLFAAAIRLVVNPALLDYYPRGGLPVLNWLLYTYWLPSACLLAASIVLRRHELARVVAWEKPLYAKGWPIAAIGTSFAGIIVFFVWINLAIADGFGSGEQLTIELSRVPARELTRSICWAIYALVLLSVGMARRATGLRWISLGMLIVTIGKVFLYDLGELQDLYRIMSLVGLAVSLTLVSLAYQRFVFRSQK